MFGKIGDNNPMYGKVPVAKFKSCRIIQDRILYFLPYFGV